jgi:hypothetical protein
VATPTNSIPSGCALITGATSLTYKVSSLDLSKYIAVREVASNRSGTTLQFSATTRQVATVPDSNSTNPTITDTSNKAITTLRSGQTIRTTGVDWTGTPTPTRSFQWFVCDDRVSAGETLP